MNSYIVSELIQRFKRAKQTDFVWETICMFLLAIVTELEYMINKYNGTFSGAENTGPIL